MSKNDSKISKSLAKYKRQVLNHVLETSPDHLEIFEKFLENPNNIKMIKKMALANARASFSDEVKVMRTGQAVNSVATGVIEANLGLFDFAKSEVEIMNYKEEECNKQMQSIVGLMVATIKSGKNSIDTSLLTDGSFKADELKNFEDSWKEVMDKHVAANHKKHFLNFYNQHAKPQPRTGQIQIAVKPRSHKVHIMSSSHLRPSRMKHHNPAYAAFI